MNKKYILIIIAIILLVGGGVALANPSFFPASVQSSTATSTPTVLQAPNATSTLLTYDSYYQNVSGITTKTIDATLLIQAAATTTVTVNLAFEFSHGQAGIDCIAVPTGCEWYSDSLSSNPASFPGSANLSLTNLRVLPVSNATTSRAISVPTPTRYVRIVGKTNGGPSTVHTILVPNKERAE